MNLLKDFRKLSFSSRNVFLQLRIKHFVGSSSIKSQFNKKLEQKRYYEVLGFTSGTFSTNLTDNEIKRQYLAMIKKYHSDNITNPSQKIDYEQISKCIILAYERITAERIEQKIDQGIYEDIYKDEDEVAMKIFGKKFNQIKYELYKEENSKQKAKFMEELQNTRKESKYYEFIKSRQEDRAQMFKMYAESYYSKYKYEPSVSSKVEKLTAKQIIPLFTVIGAITVFLYSKITKNKETQIQEKRKSKHTLGQDKIKQIEKKSMESYENKLNNLINSFVEQMPPSLKFPSKGDPQQIDQLIEYTIGPDIHLYEVSSKLLADQPTLQKFKSFKTLEAAKIQFGKQLDPFPLTKLKVNSAISLSLQAQRCLQNIYIKVKDVADQIQQTGKYVPPKIFFRFYGYIMFEIRQKPLSLDNYRDTEYVSLFDLFFDYYSPIPHKRHQYNQYVVGITDEDLKMYGQVHLNHRKIPERYITKEDKIVIMRDKLGFEEPKYSAIWHNFYQKYMRIWNRGYEGRISTQHANY